MSKKVIVVGAGAAGLMAAGRAAERGMDVCLLEQNKILGKKLLITGKGRCNITNDTDIENVIGNVPSNGKFLYGSLYSFSNYDIVGFFNNMGVKTKVERGGRVFPVSDNAEDVVDALYKYAKKNNVKICLNKKIKKIIIENNQVKGILTDGGEVFEAESVVIATGGASYPKTGSTGDGYRMAEESGHKIIDIKPSLVPIIAKEQWIKELQGLSLKNVSINVIDKNGEKLYYDFGEMLFTHYGLSGPIILSASRHMLKSDYSGVWVYIDLKPALNEEKLDERIKRDFDKFSNKQYKNSLNDLLPSKLIPVFIKLSGVDETKTVNQITKTERKNIVNLLKNFKVEIVGARPISEAIVTAGGVAINQINPSTMQSKIINGLYFAGEVIDVDGYTGGYNLTIAFSTGYVAGDSV